MDIKWTLKPEDIERIRLGWVCFKCLDPQPNAFPEVCVNEWCGYEIRRRQLVDFTENYEGEERVGPSTTLTQEMDRLDETHEKRLHNPLSHIWLPRGVE